MPISVFIVDDHGIVRDGLRFLIEVEGEYKVIGVAATGDEAVERLRMLQPEIAIIDILMPDIDGIEVIRRIRAEDSSVKILVLSMVNDGPTVREAIGAGANGYLIKDSGSEELFEALQAIRHNRRYLSANLQESLADEEIRSLRTEQEKSLLAQLSPREQQILPFVVEGYTSAQIGVELGLATSTVDTYRSRMMHKLQARSVADLVRLAIRLGLTSANR